TLKALEKPLFNAVKVSAGNLTTEREIYDIDRRFLIPSPSPVDFNLAHPDRNKDKSTRVYTEHELLFHNCLMVEDADCAMAFNAMRFSTYQYLDQIDDKLWRSRKAGFCELPRLLRASTACRFFKENLFVSTAQEGLSPSVSVAYAER